MELSPAISNTSIPKNVEIKPDNSTPSAIVLGEPTPHDRRRSDIYQKFNDPNGSFPLDVHVTSDIARLRVFSKDRNLYEILLHKKAKHQAQELNVPAAIGTTIGTIVPALIIYAMKLKKGQVSVNLLEGINKIAKTGKELNYENIQKTIREVYQHATPEVKVKVDSILVKLDKINKKKPDIALNQLFKKAGLVKPKKLNDVNNGIKFYFNQGKEKYIENTFNDARELYQKKIIKNNSEKHIEKNFWSYLIKTDELKLPEVLLIGLGSVGGGYAGGVVKDKGKINKKKTKEANYQLINNVICPTIGTDLMVGAFGLSIKPPKGGLVAAGGKLGVLKHIGKGAAAIFIGVGTGVTLGTKLANWANKQYFKDEKYERKIGHFDVLIHADDIPLALNFMHVPLMDKFLLACSGLLGYKAGEKE